MVLAKPSYPSRPSLIERRAGYGTQSSHAIGAYSTHVLLNPGKVDFVATSGLAMPDISASKQPVRHGPSLIWKAYAAALRPYLSTDDDMASRGMAMFIASPFTLGIPGGSLVPAEIRNQQIVNRCDRLMVPDSPIYEDSSSNASYFETLFNYLSSVDVTSSVVAGKARLAEARAKLKAVQEAALVAYNNDQARFLQVRSLDSTVNFTGWMRDFGIEYMTAFTELQEQQMQYKQLLSNTSGPVGAAMDLMLAARTKLSLQAGSNMPCSAQDVMSAVGSDGSKSPIALDHNSVFYRPLHSLSGYDRCVDGWISEYDSNRPPTISVELDLKAATRLSWSSFGFPDVLDAPAQPPVATVDSGMTSHIKRTTEPTITIGLYGVQAFDVERGFWNIDGIRHSEVVQAKNDIFSTNKLMKITRVLCGYKVQVKIAGGTRSEIRRGAKSTSFESPYSWLYSSPSTQAFLGTLKSGENWKGGSFKLTTQNDSVMVPQLLAVLARRI
ncbi:hypothetical protein Slin15195_G089080 [Septoria linicola]|uniref:Uncharacterized protein n=1 Tax=Septoria linicola TaxID=215465 RepID=A0A9Q9EML0_9PEZI|nr:hypothetical protein Slin15195_G089080 [Septoria linicola]